MSKKLNTDTISSELSSGAFFKPHVERPQEDEPAVVAPAPAERPGRKATDRPASSTASTPDSSTASKQSSGVDSLAASTSDSETDSATDISPDSQLARKPARGLAIARASETARNQASGLADELADSDDVVDTIYRLVRRAGKDTAFVRMSGREKSGLVTLIGTINQQYGWKVTETELIRIAICALIADHTENNDESLLMRVIVALKD